MILRVEKQRSVQLSISDSQENSAMFTKAPTYGRSYINKPSSGSWIGGNGRGNTKKSKEEKAKMICDYCQESGHEMSECFKLHGYPDWYIKLKEQKGKSVAMHVTDTTLNLAHKNTTGEGAKDTSIPNISNIIQQEIAKYLSGRMNSMGSLL